ncbi:MAG: ATP-binding protein [Bacteroidales bacterium]|nr:ATP-binding protein [Bacteroidales bacterium]
MKNIVLSQKEELKHLQSIEYIERVQYKDSLPLLGTDLIKLITGPRRAGKSVFAMQLLAGKSFGYLNFDDAKLLSEFDEEAVYDALREVYPDFEYLLLDEVQNLPNWDLWVSKLKRRGVNLVITGSNAKMLSSEMATVLTGRYVEIEILPFSPEEARLLYKSVDDMNYEYLKCGGFPEVVKHRDIMTGYLSSLYDSIILKDIVHRYKVRKTDDLRNLSDFLLENYGNQLSYNEITRFIGLSSVNTAKKFCGYLSEPYLFFFLPRFDNKVKLMYNAPQKIYIVDNGFITAKSISLSENLGRMFENQVFVSLMRSGYKPGNGMFYYRTKSDKEIDFVTKEGNKIKALIQVSYDISNPKTREREFAALCDASTELNCDNLIVVTWSYDDIVEYKGKVIKCVSRAQL